MPKDCLESIEKWLDSCASMFKDVDLAKIINMDETSIYLDYPCNYSSRAKNPLTSKKGKMKFRIKSISNQFSFLNNFFIFHFFQILFVLQSVTNFVTFCNTFSF